MLILGRKIFEGKTKIFEGKKKRFELTEPPLIRTFNIGVYGEIWRDRKNWFELTGVRINGGRINGGLLYSNSPAKYVQCVPVKKVKYILSLLFFFQILFFFHHFFYLISFLLVSLLLLYTFFFNIS